MRITLLFPESAFWAVVGAVKTRSCYPLEQKKLPFLPSTDLEIVNMFLWPVGQQQHRLGRHAALCGGGISHLFPSPNPAHGAGAALLRWPPAPSAQRAQKGQLTWEPPCFEDQGEGGPLWEGGLSCGEGHGRREQASALGSRARLGSSSVSTQDSEASRPHASVLRLGSAGC